MCGGDRERERGRGGRGGGGGVVKEGTRIRERGDSEMSEGGRIRDVL